MKKIESVVRHYKLEDIKSALTAVGVLGMTVCEVRGFGRQRGHKESYQGAEYTVDFMPKVNVEVVVEDNKCQETIGVICESDRRRQGLRLIARTGCSNTNRRNR